MADVSSTLKLENGKRYRWVVEGNWNEEDRTFGQLLLVKVFPEDVVSIEELPDPEPQWVDSTVVRVPSLTPFQRFNGKWHIGPVSSDDYGTWVSDAWKAGTLEILYQPSEDW